jgi:hypothetical protein
VNGGFLDLDAALAGVRIVAERIEPQLAATDPLRVCQLA